MLVVISRKSHNNNQKVGNSPDSGILVIETALKDSLIE